MTLQDLENLVKIKQLKREAFNPSELAGLLHSAATRLNDAKNQSLSIESRFDLAYNASHALSLAALRKMGFRSESRYTVFQCLPHTLQLPAADWRVLATCHQRRNIAEYEGHLEIEERLLHDLIAVTEKILVLLQQAES